MSNDNEKYRQKLKLSSIKSKKSKISTDDMFQNLLYISSLIEEFENFVFFGTLLGLVRDNNIIADDDDIDFYVNINHRDKLVKKLKSHSIIIDENVSINKTNYFLQAFRKFDDKIFLIDFYFYDSNVDKEFIIEKWNFQGMPNIEGKHLRIPKIFIYPIQNKKYKSGLINFPSQEIQLCEFLYGPNWKKKIKKDEDYTIKVINNKPVLFKIKKSFFNNKLEIDLT